MRDAVRELMTGLNATMYWLAFISPLPVDDLMTQSSSSELLLLESLFFLQETMKKIIPKRKIYFCMCVMFFLLTQSHLQILISAKGFNKSLHQYENNAVICEKTK